ncbi:MAG: hypothetical protein K2L54_00070, partial [Clostridiales bacterium]|nr:hypothetical protein [Clostridiales bacterium]
MKRKDENFIGKQLSTLSEYAPDGNEREPSAELDFRTHTLAHAYAVPQKEKTQKNKRKRFWACFAPSATAILCTVLCCVFLIPQKSSPNHSEPEFYYEADLISSSIHVSYAHL